jgi:hypothetical protein
MPTITSRVHPGTASGVLRLVADWTAGIWDLNSVAFTIPTGLAGRRTTTPSSLPAFRTCYGSLCLSAQGESRDLQHSSPMLARCGNIALRDIAHMGICPIHADVPHTCTPLSPELPGGLGSLYNGCSKHVPPIIDWPRKTARGRTIFSYRSSRAEVLVFPQQCLSSRMQPCQPLVERA